MKKETLHCAEILSNLLYLIRSSADDPVRVVGFVGIAEEKLAVLIGQLLVLERAPLAVPVELPLDLLAPELPGLLSPTLLAPDQLASEIAAGIAAVQERPLSKLD